MSEGDVFCSRTKGITVRVTREGVTIDNVVYPFLKPAAVFARVEHPSRVGPLLVMGVGVSFFIDRILQASLGAAVPAGFVAIVGAVWFKECKPVYCVDLAAVCADHAPILRGAEEWITAIAKAINEVIADQEETQATLAGPFLGESEATERFIQHP
jgi:hypothetical protein